MLISGLFISGFDFAMGKNKKIRSEDNTNVLPSMLARKDGGAIAYEFIPGDPPGITFFPGLKSDMNGAKVGAIRAFCLEQGHSFLRFDYRGHGASSGDFEEFTIGDWVDDSLYVLDSLTKGPQILVGSSMGGWLILLIALRRIERIVGLMGLAAAPDFTENLIWNNFSAQQKKQIAREGFIDFPNCYELQDPFRITYNLVEEGRNHLILENAIPIDLPVRLIHGIKDEDVPFSVSQKVSEKIESNNVEVIFIKSGDHRLSRESDLRRIIEELDSLIEKTRH